MAEKASGPGKWSCADGVELGVPANSRRKTYSVVLDGVENEIETIDSFAIKFGLLANMPVTRARHLVGKLPSVVWTGDSQSRAQGLLSLIKEAGGAGRIVEERESSAARGVANHALPGPVGGICGKCGFPIKKGEETCQFCLTPANGRVRRPGPARAATKHILQIPPARLLLYLVILFAALMVSIAARM